MKLKIVFIFIVFAFISILVKLFLIQILPSKTSGKDYLSRSKINSERGRIFDIHNESLAVNQISYTLFAEPKKITEKDKIIRKIDEVLGIGEATVEARIDSTKDWSKIVDGVTKEQKDKLVKFNLVGIGFDENQKRYYPESSLSAHLLGFVGKKANGEDLGYFGIEGYYDKELSGLPGIVSSERDLAGRPIFFGTQEKVDPENGRDLILTIDNAVQTILKNRLKEGLEKYKAKEGCIIAADPMSMDILGMSCLPDFDPEKYYIFDENYFKNSAISNLYEPGSTLKPLIMAAAINNNSIKADDTYDETGPVSVGEYKIRTWDNKYSGKISMTQILEKSSNVGMVYIGSRMGKDKLYDAIKNYGFGKITNIDLQGEVTSELKSKNLWYPIDFSTLTFGQGIAVTPIQMVTAFSSIVNGGELLEPHVIKKIIDGNSIKEQNKRVVRRVISEKTSNIIKKMLVDTVEHGEVSWAKPKGYSFGGKTGTAQIPIQGHYDPTKTIASFIGFAPVEKPKFIMLVILREPGTSQWGSETAAPLFFDASRELLVYYNISPQ